MPLTRTPVSPWARRLAIALTVALVGCNSGASNPAGPTTARQNLPQLANAPQNPSDLNQVKRIKVTGKVVDATTGQPLEKVKILLTSEVSAQPPTLPKATPTPPPAPTGSDALPAPGSAPAAAPAPIAPGALPSPAAPEAPAAPPKVESFTTTTNNEGKFFFNGIPEGTFSVSLAAPKYRLVTLSNVDVTKLENVQLAMRADGPRKSVKGAVVSAGGQPVAGALVSPVFRPGQGFPTFVPTDDRGQFLLDELTSVPNGFAAISQGTGGQIVAFSLLEPPAEEKKEDKGWLDGLFKPKVASKTDAKPDAPVKLTVKAVTETVVLNAEVDPEGAAADYEPTEAAVFMTLNAKGDEALVYRSRLKDGSFKTSLPPVPGDGSYHLRVRAVGPEGASSYHHRYKLQGGEKDIKLAFLPAPTEATVKVDKQVPTFSWEPVVGADAYRVQIDRANGETIWQGWTTKSSLTYPSGKDFETLNPKETLMWTVSAIKGLPGGKVDPSKLLEGEWTDLGMTGAMELDLSGKAKKNERKVVGRPSPSPKPTAAGAKPPAAKPSAKAPAVKPTEDKPEAEPSPAPTAEPSLEPLVPDETLDLPDDSI